MKSKNIGWNFHNSYLSLPKIYYSKISLNPVNAPKLIILNESLGRDLGLNIDELKGEEGINILAGNQLIEDSTPIAQAYGGHQFGYFNMLGDGRAMLIGEQVSPSGEHFDIQLKGSGRTPYSRGGDGRAGLGPMLREYIISEGMRALGIPTTASLAVVETGEEIRRETPLSGAILTRVASSHLRVGTFQYGSAWGSLEDLKELAHYAINRHYPHIKLDENPYLSLLREVIGVQAKLIAKWQLVGFIHGVMNTDNMTISGEGIDYGPCAFMDVYNPGTVFSSIDRDGRYAYGNQPKIGEWNLTRFAESLLPLIHEDEEESIKLAEKAIKDYGKIYSDKWTRGMGYKLGIFNIEEGDRELIEELLSLMEKYKADYTNSFIDLTFNQVEEGDLYTSDEFKDWYGRWKSRLKKEERSVESIEELMKKSNPAVIPRNHLVERALRMAVNEENYDEIYKLLHILSEPYNHLKDYGEYGEIPEESLVPYRTFCGT